MLCSLEETVIWKDIFWVRVEANRQLSWNCSREVPVNAGKGTSLSTMHCFVPGAVPPVPAGRAWLCPWLGLHMRGWTFLERGEAAPSLPWTRTVPLSPFRVVGLILARAILVQGLFLWWAGGQTLILPSFSPWPGKSRKGRRWPANWILCFKLVFGWSKPYIWVWLFMRQTVFILAFFIYNLLHRRCSFTSICVVEASSYCLSSLSCALWCPSPRCSLKRYIRKAKLHLWRCVFNQSFCTLLHNRWIH